MTTALFYADSVDGGEIILLNRLTYSEIYKAMGLSEIDNIIEQYPWPDKPYAMLSLEDYGPDSVVRLVSDEYGFTKEIGGPLMFFRSEISDDDYNSLTDDDIKFIKSKVSEGR